MKKKFLSLLLLVALFTITGCGKSGETKSNYKTYECKYNKEDNTEGKKYLTKYKIE